MKKQIPEKLRKQLSAAGRSGWQAKIAKAIKQEQEQKKVAGKINNNK